jgi:tRNA (guanine37-N1)-methyltransferase
MKIDIITIFPDMFAEVFKAGIVGQALKSNKIEINIRNLRDYTHLKHNQVDDRPFGGGAGMVLMPEPLFEAVEALKADSPEAKVIFLTPSGKKFTQAIAEDLSKNEHLILICGRYEGIDQRVIDTLVDFEISIGDYVLSGGEIPAMVLVDSISRLIPGIIKNENFNDSESFSNPENREQLDFPQYTRPEDFRGMKVPEILLSGNHKEVEKWRESARNSIPE